MKEAPVRILILGGTGFIGPHAAEALAKRGHEIALFNRGLSQAELPAGALRITGNFKEIATARSEFAQFSPDVTLDMIPIGQRHARAVTAALDGIAKRLIAISSMDVYRAYGMMIGIEPGPPDPMPLAENAPLRSVLHPYSHTKLLAVATPFAQEYDKILVEQTYMDGPIPATILRLPYVYGPRDYQHRLYPFLKRMDDGRPIIPLAINDSRTRLSRAYVVNVAEAIALAVEQEHSAQRIYNVCEPVALTTSEWAHAIARIVGWNGKIAEISEDNMPGAGQAGDELHLVCDSSRIRAELGYVEPVGQAAALARTIAWERANPPADIEAAGIDYAKDDEIIAKLELE